MKRTTYQVPELRDENDNIIQQGAFGKNTALANSTNDGWIDYVANDLMYLYNNTMGGTGGEINTETITGKTGTITNLTATTVKAGTLTADALNGPLTGNVTGTADKAVADGKGNNIVNTYVTKSDLSSSVSTTSLTVSGETSVPTANAGNSSKAIANTEYVQGELTNYLPLSGGTVSGNLTVEGTITGNLAGNATNATNATNDANGSPIAGTYLPLAGGSITGNVDITRDLFVGGNLALIGGDYVENGKVFAIGNTTTGNVDLGWSWANSEGAGLALRSTDYSSPGEFSLYARNSANSCSLTGKPDGTLTWNSQPLLPVGVVQAFAGTTIPSGWLLCDGSAVSRTTYASLYACIGTTYGSGNGSTTFNLPNLIDKFVEGSATAGTVKSAGLPNIIAKYDDNIGYANADMIGWHGAVYLSNLADSLITSNRNGDDRKYCHTWQFDASHSNSIYGNSTTVQPPALTMRYIIKY